MGPDIFKYQFFISSSSKDIEFVKGVLEPLKGLKVFCSEIDLKKNVGEAYFEVISEAIFQSRHFILVVSPYSMTSKWVKIEYQTFFNNCYTSDENRRILLLKGEGYSLKDVPLFFRNFQIADNIEQVIASFQNSVQGIKPDIASAGVLRNKSQSKISLRSIFYFLGILLVVSVGVIFSFKAGLFHKLTNQDLKKDSTILASENYNLEMPVNKLAVDPKELKDTILTEVSSIGSNSGNETVKTIIGSDGNKYVGQVKDGKKHGQGIMYYYSSSRISKLDFEKRIGEKDDYLEGTWYEGELEYGKLFDKNGKLKETLTIGR